MVGAAPPAPPLSGASGLSVTNPARLNPLSATLRQLRREANLSGVEAARRARLSQAAISRFENGKRVPADADLRALCEVYRAPAATRRQLLSIARDLRERSTSTRAVLHRHGAPAG